MVLTTSANNDPKETDHVQTEEKVGENGSKAPATVEVDTEDENTVTAEGETKEMERKDSNESKNLNKIRFYRDYSRFKLKENNGLTSLGKTAAAKEPPFPVKLHWILSTPGFEDIICWMPHGRSWRILKGDLFEQKVLPQFFCHSRLSSFMRQVNGWGFRRIKHGPDYNSYYNELFLRGLPHLTDRMRRESVNARSKAKGSAESEPTPDLYKISKENPLPEKSVVAPVTPPISMGRVSQRQARLADQTGLLRNTMMSDSVSMGAHQAPLGPLYSVFPRSAQHESSVSCGPTRGDLFSREILAHQKNVPGLGPRRFFFENEMLSNSAAPSGLAQWRALSAMNQEMASVAQFTRASSVLGGGGNMYPFHGFAIGTQSQLSLAFNQLGGDNRGISQNFVQPGSHALRDYIADLPVIHRPKPKS